jgi:hypothetical protein
MGTSAGATVGTFLICGAVVFVPLLIGLAVWMFFRSAVRSGVQQGTPQQPPPQAVPQPGGQALTEDAVRAIVRDEIRRLQAARNRPAK